MAELQIQYSTSTAFASAIIRRLSHSPFSHVDIMLPGEGLLGVSGEDTYVFGGKTIHDPGGVRLRPFAPWPYLKPPKIARLQTSDVIAAAVVVAARSQIGKPFDNSALWGFLEDQATGVQKERDWRDTTQWFCSEYVAWCLETSKFFPYPLVAAKNRITPADSLLLINPFMTAESIAGFDESKTP